MTVIERVEARMAEAVDSIATTLRVHCAAERTRKDVTEDWIMDAARNAAMALWPVFLKDAELIAELEEM